MTSHIVAQRHRLDIGGGLRDVHDPYLDAEEDEDDYGEEYKHSPLAAVDSPRPSSSLPSSAFAGQHLLPQGLNSQQHSAGLSATRPGPSAMTRNFSRPNHPYNSAPGGPSNGNGARRFSFEEGPSPGSSRPPSLSFSASRDSEGHVDSPRREPITPSFAPNDFLNVRPSIELPTDDDEAENVEIERSSNGFVKKLRHAASSSGLGRSLTGKRSLSAKLNNAMPTPGERGDEDGSDYFSQVMGRTASSSSTAPSPAVPEKPLPSITGEFEAARGRKASFGNRKRPEYIDLSVPGTEKKKGMKKNFLKALIIGGDRSNDTFLPPPPASAPAHATEFNDATLMTRGSSATGQPLPSQGQAGSSKADRILGLSEGMQLSKADRVLGFNETQRRRETRFMAELFAKRQDPLAEFAPDWREPRTAPSRIEALPSVPTTAASSSCSSPNSSDAPLPPTMPEEVQSVRPPMRGHHHVESASTEDSFTTASSSDSRESRVSAVAPQLMDNDMGSHSRELSLELTEDINAVLQSQRNSFQKVDQVMAVHRQINKRNSSMRHHRKTSSTSSSRSTGFKPAVSSSLASSPPVSTGTAATSATTTRHNPSSSISASEASVTSTTSSARSRSTSTTSGSSRSQRWGEDSTLPPVATSSRPGLSLRYNSASHNKAPPRSSVIYSSEPMARVCSEPMANGAGPVAGPGVAAAAHPFAFPAVRPSLRTSKTATAVPRARLAPTRAARMLSDLPALSTLLHSCLLASKCTPQSPWHGLTHRTLCASSPKELIPRSWAGFIKAYALGDFDLSEPPRPRSAPLVQHAVPRSSPNPAMERRVRQTSLESGPLDSFPSANGIGIDFAFPMPPSRADGQEKSLDSPGQRLEFLQVLHNPRRGSEATVSTVAAKSPLLDGAADDPEDALLMEAEEVLAVGGMGDLKAPRPPFEAERQQSTMQYLSAIGVDGQSVPTAYQSSRLVAIVDRLATMLSCGQAKIQLISDDEVILLAKAGQTVRTSEDEGGRTPRAEDVSSERGMLGLDLFGQAPAPAAPLRDASLDAHALLSRHGAPVVFSDVSNDWRFSARASSDGAGFFVAASIMSDDGLPIGTVSVSDAFARPAGLSREERHWLAEASREVSAELEQLRRMALGNKLARLDESLTSWSFQSEEVVEETQPVSWSPQAQPMSIESTLLLAPLGQQPGMTAPPSPGTLAQRRGKVPQNIAVAPLARPSQAHLPLHALRTALQTIVEALQMDLAYIAHVTPRPQHSSPNATPFQCSIVVQHEREATMQKPTTLRPDIGLHLCALAAPTKRGLHFQQDPARVSELLGRANASSDDVTFHTAAVVNCGLRGGVEGITQDGRIGRDTEGWVLCVASKSKRARFAPESTIYLLRFASLLIPMMLESAAAAAAAMASTPSPPSSASATSSPARWNQSPSTAASALPSHLTNNVARPARSGWRGVYTTSPPSGRIDAPLSSATTSAASSASNSPTVSRARALSPALRRNASGGGGGGPPPLSPPPNEPLPMLPKTPSPIVALRNLPAVPTRPSPPHHATSFGAAGRTVSGPVAQSSLAPSSTLDDLGMLASLPSTDFADLGREWAEDGNSEDEGEDAYEGVIDVDEQQQQQHRGGQRHHPYSPHFAAGGMRVQ